MRFRKALKTLDIMGKEEVLSLFDRAAWTLGFQTHSAAKQEPLDIEVAVVILAFLLDQHDLRLARFRSVLVNWLQKYHRLLIPSKFLKMAQATEEALGELPSLRLAMQVLRSVGGPQFKNFPSKPLTLPFYGDSRTASLVDKKLGVEGYYLGLNPELGFRIPKSAYPFRASDMLNEDELLKRNEQLRNRLLHGTNFTSDGLLLLRDHPDMTASELSDTLMLSYEPANRLVNNVKHVRSLGYAIPYSREVS